MFIGLSQLKWYVDLTHLSPYWTCLLLMSGPRAFAFTSGFPGNISETLSHVGSISPAQPFTVLTAFRSSGPDYPTTVVHVTPSHPYGAQAFIQLSDREQMMIMIIQAFQPLHVPKKTHRFFLPVTHSASDAFIFSDPVGITDLTWNKTLNTFLHTSVETERDSYRCFSPLPTSRDTFTDARSVEVKFLPKGRWEPTCAPRRSCMFSPFTISLQFPTYWSL